jgi:heme A synthase
MQIKHLSLAATTSIYILMIIGSYTSASGSGLACPDWPLCPIDFTNKFVIIEFIHRIWAIITFLLVIVTASMIIIHHDVTRNIKKSATILLIMFLIQILWGALVIFQQLNPLIVAIHQGLATLVFALSIYTTTLLYITKNNISKNNPS